MSRKVEETKTRTRRGEGDGLGGSAMCDPLCKKDESEAVGDAHPAYDAPLAEMVSRDRGQFKGKWGRVRLVSLRSTRLGGLGFSGDGGRRPPYILRA
jgi:hypothetical protein